MLIQVKPDLPIILTDTGYLFPETYRFIDELTEQGIDGLTQYNQINKVEPMKRALQELGTRVWFSGLRRSQSSNRESLPVLSIQNGCFKFLPIIDWSNKDVHYYLKEHGLNYHPLWEQNYVSVGDVHTSQPLQAGMTEEDTRFFGLKRECGLHEDDEVDGSGI